MDETSYRSTYSGTEIDSAIGAVLNPDATPTEGSTKPVSSQGIRGALPKVMTALIIAPNTNASISITPAKEIITAYAIQGGEIVLVDISTTVTEYEQTRNVTFSVAEAPTSQVTCVAVFKGD